MHTVIRSAGPAIFAVADWTRRSAIRPPAKTPVLQERPYRVIPALSLAAARVDDRVALLSRGSSTRAATPGPNCYPRNPAGRRLAGPSRGQAIVRPPLTESVCPVM